MSYITCEIPYIDIVRIIPMLTYFKTLIASAEHIYSY
jgi:hypothetical protein